MMERACDDAHWRLALMCAHAVELQTRTRWCGAGSAAKGTAAHMAAECVQAFVG